jgi:flagellar operon protein
MKVESPNVGRVGGLTQHQPTGPQKVNSGEFQNLLDGLQKPASPQVHEIPKAGGPSELKFSRHAMERMHSRGITFPRDQIAKMEVALEKAQAKGVKDTLIIAGDKALVVNAKTGTVVTVMEKANMGEQIVTNIDSTILI